MKAFASVYGSTVWSFITRLSTVETTDPHLQRRGQLLALYHILILGILIYTLVNNSLYLLFQPGIEYTIYLIQDIVLFALFYFLWWLNKKGRVILVGYVSITLTILLAIVVSEAKYLEYSMVIFALPIAMSSFIIRPSISFLYAFLTAAGYTFYSILEGYVWEYNLTAIIALFAIAFMTWVISHQLQTTLQTNDKLVADLQNTFEELKEAYETTLQGWSKALEFRDRETQGHSERVSNLTLRLARRVGVPEEQIVHIMRGVLLHDIGKIGIPDDILRKPGPLTESETRIMRLHPQIAVDLLSSIEYLKPALNIPRYHHEKWDGSGYPHGLIGESIPLEARIFAIVDVFDALSHDRPYRRAMPKPEVLKYIRSESGKHFDPAIVDIFLGEIEKGEN